MSDRAAISERVQDEAAELRRLGVFSLGFLRQPALRAQLAAAGWRVTPGFAPHDTVGVWGRRPVSARGHLAARLSGKPVVTIEDGFLRSVAPGPRAATVSLILDDLGIYHDASRPSRLERLIEAGEGDRPRAEAALARLRALRLSKYNAGARMASPPRGHVLVIDQTAGDASIAGGLADASSFARMLDAAKAEHPGAEIVIKSHPDVLSGRKRGHFSDADAKGSVRFFAEDVNVWDLIEGAHAVYAVTSQLGFEALLAGRPVRCFGAPFYAGWGVTMDEVPVPRRGAKPDLLTLFAAAYLDYPVYFDPWRGGLTTPEAAMEALAHLRDARLAAGAGAVATGVRLWKRAHVAAFLGAPAVRVSFDDDGERAAREAARSGRRLAVWAGRETPALAEAAERAGAPLWRIEDGFLRSVGLGAELTPPLSLAIDDLGVYYDPTRPSRLEALIADAPTDEPALARARALREAVVALNLTKYNLTGAAPPAAPAGKRRILVPGQVEDDASIRLGAGAVRTNLALLEAVRRAAPDAWILYKPHPDIEAGLRPGRVAEADLARLADAVAAETPAHLALDAVDEVWTMTSLIGFEALMRDKPVTVFGAPFYAGWGLTEDRGEIPARRRARPTLDQLVHAALIGYPTYLDPVSGLPCPVEVIVERLAARETGRARPANRALAKLQGLFATYAHLWR